MGLINFFKDYSETNFIYVHVYDGYEYNHACVLSRMTYIWYLTKLCQRIHNIAARLCLECVCEEIT